MNGMGNCISRSAMRQQIFFHQSTTGPDKDLCAFFAARHFLGTLDKSEFLDLAKRFYMKPPLSMSEEDAAEMVNQGNDPELVTNILTNKIPYVKVMREYHHVEQNNRILIALKNSPHFITLIKQGEKWWNYDSLLTAASKISDINKFLKNNSGKKYWAAS
jgi:hypothetical protein